MPYVHHKYLCELNILQQSLELRQCEIHEISKFNKNVMMVVIMTMSIIIVIRFYNIIHMIPTLILRTD